MRVLVVEPYYGGSHKAVLDALVPELGYECDLLTLPARKWKWRMRGAGIVMAEEAARLHASGVRWDLVYASTFVNLPEFLALARPALDGVPVIVYFHENQLMYPVRHEAEWDFQFPLTNITSALVADACLFNTQWHRDGFLERVGPFLKQFPDFVPKGVAERIAAKSVVLPPPFDPRPFDAHPPRRGARVRIVWPHRWEHDKDPEAFFTAVHELAAEGLDFQVVVAGQAFRDTREAVERMAARLGSRLAAVGEPQGRDAYAELLAGADVAVSTARNEFFGLAMVESCYAGCWPIVPDRLAYPELYPAEHRYRSPEELVARLRALVLDRPAPGSARSIAERFTVKRLAPEYRAVFEDVAKTRSRQ